MYNTIFNFYVWVSVHHKLIYIKRTNVMQLGIMFISNCNIAIHVSDLGRLVGYLTPSVSSINVHAHCISLNCYWYSPIPIISSQQ